MNRQKYVSNEDYREGYEDGVREGKRTVYSNTMRKLMPIMEAFSAFITFFNEQFGEAADAKD